MLLGIYLYSRELTGGVGEAVHGHRSEKPKKLGSSERLFAENKALSLQMISQLR